MPVREQTAKAPGKLYIAGEYAVVEPGHAAILVAVGRFLTVHVLPHAGATGHILSHNHPHSSTTWHRQNGRLQADGELQGTAFVTSAINAVETLAQERGIGLSGFDVEITSGLDDGTGRKYGLGSSAAVTVATVRALSTAYGLELEPMELYKLAFIAASHAQRVGSGGDLAASLFGGCILFRSPNRQWVSERSAGDRPSASPIGELIHEPWPGLTIRRLPVFTPVPGSRSPQSPRASQPVNELRLLVGWTGSPASTPELVSNVHANSQEDHAGDYDSFVTHSDQHVLALAQALLDLDGRAVREQIAAARSLLHDLALLTGTAIETPTLRTLVDIALTHGAAAKSSGAGGGDCAIAIAGPKVDVPAIYAQWREHGIEPLDLDVCVPLADAEVGV